MDKSLNKLTKKELIQIISKFKKESLISFILNKKGGENEINSNNVSTREFILFNKSKNIKTNNKNIMANNKLYNTIYDEDEDEDENNEYTF